MFLVTALFLNTAPTRQELENVVFQTAGIAQKYNCALKRLDYQQETGLMSCLPLAVNFCTDQTGTDNDIHGNFCPVYHTGIIYGWGIYLLWIKCPVQ